MSSQNLIELLEQWTLEGHRPLGILSPISTAGIQPIEDDETYKSLLTKLENSSSKFYSRFIPALFPPHSPNFLDRLWQWLNNEGLTPDEQRLMFQLTGRLVYFSFEDFLQLYRSAYIGPVSRWIIDELNLKLTDAAFTATLRTELNRHTWYCPITDSMVISEFYHANGITGIDQRPTFRSLHKFCEREKLKEYMQPADQSRDLKRLVLLEDFVGTGNQSETIVRWAAANLDCPILFVPLVMCPGDSKYSPIWQRRFLPGAFVWIPSCGWIILSLLSENTVIRTHCY